MYRLIQSYDDNSTIQIGDRTFPATCLVEDDDAIRLLVVSDPQIPARSWALAHADGAVAVVRHREPSSWWWVLVEQFMELRQEHHQGGFYELEDAWWSRSETPPAYRDMRTLSEPKPKAESFVHLHAHSEFSALDGLSTVKEMVKRAVENKQPALAITDHGVCASHPHLQEEADKAGVKPIFGMEANFTDDRLRRGDDTEEDVLHDYRHLILWAQNNVGLRNLWAMSTEANREGFYGRPRIDWDTLSKFSEGIMVSTACLRGPLAESILEDDEDQTRAVLARLLDLFRDRLYIEVQTNILPEQKKVNEALVPLAREFGLPLVATVDSHYPCAEDRQTHRVWLAVQTNKELQDDTELFVGDSDYFLMDRAEVLKTLDYLGPSVAEEAVDNTLTVVERCQARVEGASVTPIFSKKGGTHRDVERLVDLCLSNWDRKVKGKPKAEEVYEQRFEREMKLLIDKKFCGVFLMVSDYCRWAKGHGILVGPGRGSGGGSLVAYLADITEIDPVDADLLFERFLTEGRTALPDFDVDFPTSKRDEITRYIMDRYGEDNVLRVGTHVRLKNKGVVRDLARVMKDSIDIHYPDIDAVSEIIEDAERDKAGLGMPWDDLWDEHGDVLEPYRQKYPELFGMADKMVGRLKTYGKHPAGLVISSGGSLINRLPLRIGDEQIITEFDMEAIELLGLIKFDILTLRTLDTIQMTIDLIKQKFEVVPDIYNWSEEYADPQVWDEIGDGHTLGIFQIETRAGTRLTKRFRPRNLNELADVITLVRPGPVRSGLTETYFRRKAGEEAIIVPDPRLEEVLAPTYGTMIYQEQVMAACSLLAGYSMDEADQVRKILGKKKIEAVEEAGKKFMPRCIERGMTQESVSVLWDQMAEFARYSFNKAHAYGYAVLGFWTAWLKFHYPVQFLTAVLSTVDKPRIPEFIGEARRMGYKVLPPDVNESGKGFSAQQMTVRYGLDSVKGVGPKAVEAITQGQPYKTFDDFLERKGAAANSGIVKTLAKAGAFDSVYSNRRALEAQLEWKSSMTGSRDCVHRDDTHLGPNGLPCVYDWANEPQQEGKSGRKLKIKPIPKRCTKACRRYQPRVLDVAEIEPYSDADIRDLEMELLGIHLSSTPFDRIPKEVLENECATAEEVESGEHGEYLVAAVVVRVHPHTDQRKRQMGFVTLFAQNDNIDVVVFNDQWKEFKAHLRKNTLCFAYIEKGHRGYRLEYFQPL